MKPKKQGMSKHGMVPGIALVLAGALSLFSSAAYGQTYLYDQATFPTGNNPGAMIAGDFNGDGTLDLAVVNQNDNTVSILLAKPNGGFEPKVDYSTGIGPVALVAADFNGDGKVDLAVVGQQAGTVSILLGVGDGTFDDRVDYPTGTRPVAIVASDFNGDKRQDIACYSATDHVWHVAISSGMMFRSSAWANGPVITGDLGPQAVVPSRCSADSRKTPRIGPLIRDAAPRAVVTAELLWPISAKATLIWAMPAITVSTRETLR